MNPFEAVKFMNETGKSVSAASIPPWIKERPEADHWFKRRYKMAQNDQIMTLVDDMSCAALVIQIQTVDEWLNWWMNFCYNNSTNQTELVSNEY